MLIIELLDLRTEFRTEVEVEEKMPLGKFADMVRREMTLSCDYESLHYRKISCNGRVYMPGKSIAQYVDNLWEGADDPNDLEKRNPRYQEEYYTPEEGVMVADLFTVIGSACNYQQSGGYVRCTLVERGERG